MYVVMVTCARAAGLSHAAGNGYSDSRYIATLSHLGTPLQLPACGGHVLRRTIPGSTHADAIGPVPLFDCRDWGRLHEDMEQLGAALVSMVMIPTPFGPLDAPRLKRLFPDLMREYKRHYVVHVAGDWESRVSRHHRYYARKAVKDGVTVEAVRDGGVAGLAGEWIALYGALIRRHGINPPYDFPPPSLAAQLMVPGMYVYEARLDGAVVGMQLWLRTGRYAYYHLAAYSDAGYRRCASYAMTRHALAHLRDDGVEWADLGAGAGQGDNGSAGLDAFKSGWASESRPVYLCGRVFMPAVYHELAAAVPRNSGYFPAYRALPAA